MRSTWGAVTSHAALPRVTDWQPSVRLGSATDRRGRTMSAVDLITAALAAGAGAGVGAGVKDVSAAIVRDTYAGLKVMLKRRLGDRPEAALALDADETEPAAWQALIGIALVESGAVDDAQVLAAAQRLLDAAGRGPTKVFNFNVGTSHGPIGEFHDQVTVNQVPPIPPGAPAAG